MSQHLPKDAAAAAARGRPAAADRKLYLVLIYVIQALLVTGLVLFLLRRNWENVFLTCVVILITLVPAFLTRRYRIVVPLEFELVAVAFVFLSLFLGSALDFYYRFWWWDMFLHAASGFLLGIIGFVALFVLNQTDQIRPAMKPRFICFFGVTFAVTLGVAWEIFEFVADTIRPEWNMQSNETGVRDTMIDLIVDAAGAVLVAAMGYMYLKTGRYRFVADAVRAFLRRNPWMVTRQRADQSATATRPPAGSNAGAERYGARGGNAHPSTDRQGNRFAG
jgi:hypothetical protein